MICSTKVLLNIVLYNKQAIRNPSRNTFEHYGSL